MEQKSGELIYEIVVLGDSCVGKTNFISRYVDNIYYTKTLKTLGIDIRIKSVILNDGKIAKIKIWDTNSFKHEEYEKKIYFRGLKGFIIIYNITERYTFEHAINWLRDIKNYKDTNNIAFVGNYVDKEYDNHYYREISSEEGQKIAKDNNLLFFETSNLTGFNVNECFNALINRIHENAKYRKQINLKLNPLNKYLNF